MSLKELSSPPKELDPTLIGPEAERLEQNLKKRIVGQTNAITEIVNAYQMFLAGINTPQRPVASFLFLGPTGSGKTWSVEATAESLVGNARAVIKVDCGEFQHSHEIAKLVGSPPGYLGHKETHPILSQEILNQYHSDQLKLSFVLFDEIEKASDALWNLLLGILDKAILTLGDNRRVDFSRTMIFMTGNLGSQEMSSILNPTMGFQRDSYTPLSRNDFVIDKNLSDRIKSSGVAAARRRFTSEFINRLDRIVVFEPLGTAELRQILELELDILQKRVFANAKGIPFIFKLTQEAKDILLAEGTDLKYGARPLKRAIERYLAFPLSNLIATEQVRAGDIIEVGSSRDRGRFSFKRTAEVASGLIPKPSAGDKPFNNKVNKTARATR